MDERLAPAFLARLREGRTQEAWTEFLRNFSAHLYRVIDRFARDEEARSDCFVFVCDHLAAQDCRRLRKFEPNESALFTTWLYSVAFNLCLDWRRTQRPRLRLVSIEDTALPAGIEATSSEDPAQRAAEQIDQARLARALDRLGADDRVMIRMRYEKELTLAEIARLMGLANAQAADRRMRAIIATLKQDLAGSAAEKAAALPCHEPEVRHLRTDGGSD